MNEISSTDVDKQKKRQLDERRNGKYLESIMVFGDFDVLIKKKINLKYDIKLVRQSLWLK